MSAALRLEGPGDAGFLRWLFAAEAGAPLRRAGLSEAVVERLVDMQLRSRDATYRTRYPDARCWIIEWAGIPVGRLVEADGDGFTHVVDVAVDPAWRRRGIADAVLRGAMVRWAAAGRGGRAHVAVGNAPSLALFAALGFAGIPEDGAAQVTVTWRP